MNRIALMAITDGSEVMEDAAIIDVKRQF